MKMSISQSPELAPWASLLCTWGKAEKERKRSLGPEGHQQKTTCSFWIFCLSLPCPADNEPAVSDTGLGAFQQFLWNCCSCLQKPSLRAVCMCKGVYHGVILAAWLKKAHQGMINITNGTNSFKCQSSLSILSYCLMEQAVLAKEQFHLLYPEPPVALFFYSLFWVCC